MRKSLLIAAYGLLILVGVALIYLGLRGTFSALGDVLLVFAYIGVVLSLVRYQMRMFPREHQGFSFRISIRFRYLLKSLLCLVGAFVWSAIVSATIGDTWFGHALVLGPGMAIVGLAAYFFYRSVPNWFRR